MINYISKFFTLKFKQFPFSFIFIFFIMYLLVFVPDLRWMTMVYAMLFLVVQTVGKDVKTIRTPLGKGALLFITFFGGSLILLSFIPVDSINTLGLNLSLFSVIAYFGVVAHSEEEVFRVLLPNIMGNKLIPLLLYVFFHWFVFQSFYDLVGMAMVYALVFTFIFGFVAQFMVDKFRSSVPSKAMHLAYDIFSNGYLMMVAPLVIGGMV